jgi:hypothetical protein
MAEPANSRRLTIAEAEAFVAERRQIEPDEARRILLELLRNGKIVARGAAPLNVHPDVERAWRLSVAANHEEILSGTWFLDVDWTLSRVGRYRHIKIAETDLTASFRTSRGPGSQPSATVVKKHVEAYAAWERENRRPLSQKRVWKYVNKPLPTATRAQVLDAYRSVEGTPKTRGRPHKENPRE